MAAKTSIPGYRESAKVDAYISWMLRNLSPYLRQSGNQWRKPWYLGPRKLLDYLLVFNGGGKGIFTVGEETFDFNTGDLVIIPPDTVHVMRGISEKMHCIYIHFDMIYDPRRSNWDACIPGGTLDLSEFRQFMHPPVNGLVSEIFSKKITLKNPEHIKLLLVKLCKLHSEAESINILLASGLILELIAEIYRQLISPGNAGLMNYEKLVDAGNYISRHPEKSISVRELAHNVSLSESHFRKLFRKVHGVSPKTMLQQVRIRKACELLSYWNMNVSEVAESLNFNSIYTFSRSFKSVTGVSPTEYLKTPVN